MSRRLIEVTDVRMARAIAHPLRRELLLRLSEREASPSELAAELGESLPTVSYHVRKLAELELIELVRTTPRRGATEHHYRGVGLTYFPGETLSDLPPGLRDSLVESWWMQLAKDVEAGLDAGGWQRPEAQGLRAVLELDEQGWRELGEATEVLYRRAFEIESESQARRSGPAGRPAVVAFLLFERPHSDGQTT
jgi:DNA-binding transcriptional ArsR family regulator